MNQQRRKFHSIPLRRSAAYDTRHTTTSAHVPTIARQEQQTQPGDEDEDDQIIPRTPSSTIRYTDEYGRPVIQQGNRRYVMHQEPPPKQRGQQRQQGRRVHWLAIFGFGMCVMIPTVMLMNWIGGTWQQHQLDSQYGNPRTWQTDAVVGHGGDSAAHPSHFIFENLRGQVIIIELPAGQVAHAIIYAGPQLFGSDPTGEPVTGTFVTVNGQVDMIVHVGEGQSIMYVNNGTKFVPPTQGGQ